MNQNKIILCNLSKGIIGEDAAMVLGSFIITNIQNAAMRRANIAVQQRKGFYLFIDEAHNFLSSSFANMLSEVRKYGVGLFITHQFLEQLEPETRSAVLGNAGTIICFSIGLFDAKVMEKELQLIEKTNMMTTATHSREAEEFARETGKLLGDWASFGYYRSCAETYPREFLEDTLFYVLRIPDDLVTVTKAQAFKAILRMTYVDTD